MSETDPPPSLIIIVRDARKSDDILNPHTTYEIASSSASSAACVVRRRYKDFEWLHDALVARYPGFIVPALPDKRHDSRTLLFRFDAEFVEERRKALQTFAFNVCCHRELRNAPELAAFCTSPSPHLYSSEPVHFTLGAHPPSLSASTLAKAQTIDSEIKTETDKFGALELYLTGLEDQLQQLQQISHRISERRVKMYDFVKTLGPIFSSLSRDDASLGSALVAISQKCDAITSMYQAQASTDEARLATPLQMYKCLCASARNALRCRESALQLLCDSIVELDVHARKLHDLKLGQADPSKRSLFQRMSGGGDATEKIAKYEALVAAEGDELTKRRHVYNEVCQAIEVDAARLHAMQLQDFKTMMLSFAFSQGEFHKGIMETWSDVLPVVEAAAAAAVSKNGTDGS